MKLPENGPFALRDPAKRHIGAQLRCTDNLVFRRLNEIARQRGVEDITAMHGWILHYLYDNRGKDIYQRDIERHFSVTRSTTTNILQLMEKKGYIRRVSVPQDARLKRLVLTEKGTKAHQQIMLSLRQTDQFISSLLTEEENAELLRLLNKLRAGLE